MPFFGVTKPQRVTFNQWPLGMENKFPGTSYTTVLSILLHKRGMTSFPVAAAYGSSWSINSTPLSLTLFWWYYISALFLNMLNTWSQYKGNVVDFLVRWHILYFYATVIRVFHDLFPLSLHFKKHIEYGYVTVPLFSINHMNVWTLFDIYYIHLHLCYTYII